MGRNLNNRLKKLEQRFRVTLPGPPTVVVAAADGAPIVLARVHGGQVTYATVEQHTTYLHVSPEAMAAAGIPSGLLLSLTSDGQPVPTEPGGIDPWESDVEGQPSTNTPPDPDACEAIWEALHPILSIEQRRKIEQASTFLLLT